MTRLLATPTLPCLFFLLASPVSSQEIPIWPGPAPESEKWTHQEITIPETPLGKLVLNVVKPTITPYLPAADKATGTGIIIAPGGAFVALAIELEATRLATWLQERGIAAFVLKYRTVEKKVDGIPQMDMDTAGRYGIADGIQALKVVRRRAAEWKLTPGRIGFMGFSAGAMVTSGVLLQADSTARPDFAALIYGAPFGKMPPIPATLPPLFLAWAQDDPYRAPILRFQNALLDGGHRPEIHLYANGGHGFGMKPQGKSTDHWVEDFQNWLGILGLTRPR